MMSTYLFKPMGSCISRCSRKRKRQDHQQNPNFVQDKLVITEAPISPISLSSTIQLLSRPQSPTSTSSSVSSFSCTNGNPCTSSYSFTYSSSSSSSCSISKERSFSNEFLKTCVKENPHIIHNHVKSSFDLTPNKRARASAKPDFTISRQKTFRRGIERQSSPRSHTKSSLRSPSPSGRFLSSPMENVCNPSLIGKSVVANPKGSLVKKESIKLRPSSPRHNLTRGGPYLMTRERCKLNRSGSKIEECCYVQEVLACKHDEDGGNITMEDIENPLIALDCFIFL